MNITLDDQLTHRLELMFNRTGNSISSLQIAFELMKRRKLDIQAAEDDNILALGFSGIPHVTMIE